MARLEFKDKKPLPFPTKIDPSRGKGTYSNLVFSRSGLFLMAEYKKYENFDNELNAPPVADRDTEKNELYDSGGQRLYSQYSFRSPDLTVFFSAGKAREGNSTGSHIYGGFRLEEAFDRLSLSYTYGLRTVNYLEKKTDAGLTYRMTPLWSLEATFRDKRNRVPGSDPYSETDLSLQLARSPWGALFLTRQSSTVSVFDSSHLFSGGIRVNLPKGSYLEISGGKQRGGEICSGGQCLLLPPFKGWKIATHVQF